MAQIDLSTLPRTRKEAQELGSKLYFTGKPCPKGHLAERQTSSTDCKECKRGRDRAKTLKGWKPAAIQCLQCGAPMITTFKPGRSPEFCSPECRAAAMRGYRQDWERGNPEKRRAQVSRRRAWHKDNKTPLWVAAIRRHSKYISKRRLAEPSFRMSLVLRNRLWSAIRGGRGRKHSSASVLVGCTWNHLRTHLESQFAPGMTWENYGQWHIDHIRPCASFDLTDPEQQKECFHYTNLQPLWALENMKKGARLAA
jgi:hypothetical protein